VAEPRRPKALIDTSIATDLDEIDPTELPAEIASQR
jgi:hypothetical protein